MTRTTPRRKPAGHEAQPACPAGRTSELVQGVVPLDGAERADRERAARWLAATDDIWRRARPATPSPHLVSRREAEDELGLREVSLLPNVPAPFFLTWTRTVGRGQHIDVSLWFAVHARVDRPLVWDHREFHSVRWCSFDEVQAADASTLDPQMGRALTELEAALGVRS